MKLDMPVIGILRGIDADFFGEVLAMSFANGLQAIEVTINTSGAEEMVSRYRGKVPPGNLLGMGTVRDLEEARRAVAAGAMFLVTPNLEPKVIEFANRQDIPIIAGALTPTEVYGAWRAGADMVKVFPCGALGGSRYIRELRGPFDQIPLVAVGGVSLDNLGDYFAAGARAVGVSTSLFGREALRNRDIERIGKHVKKFIEQCPVNG